MRISDWSSDVALPIWVETAFIASGVAMLASLLLVFVFPLSNDEAPDITPARTHPVDDLQGPVGANDGPIVVTIEYRVRPMNFGAFVAAMEDLGRIRRRNGARSEEHTSDLQSLMRISYAVFCLKKQNNHLYNSSNTILNNTSLPTI